MTDKGPSAASLETARGLLMASPWPYEMAHIEKVALALDAAIRVARKEALGQAAALIDARYVEVMAKQGGRDGGYGFESSVDLNVRMMAVLLPDLAESVRAHGGRMSGQEPEDVALRMAAQEILRTMDDCAAHGARPGLDAVEEAEVIHDDQMDALVPILTRLVRAGQRRELEALDREVIKLECDPATRMEVVAYGVRAGTMFVRRISEAVHARLALLREE